MYGTGLGVPESDQAKAIIYYTFSALGGNPLAQMAMVCNSSPYIHIVCNRSQTIKHRREQRALVGSLLLQSLNVSISSFQGYRYYFGVGVPQNCEQALSYYQMVAKKVCCLEVYKLLKPLQRLRVGSYVLHVTLIFILDDSHFKLRSDGDVLFTPLVVCYFLSGGGRCQILDWTGHSATTSHRRTGLFLHLFQNIIVPFI